VTGPTRRRRAAAGAALAAVLATCAGAGAAAQTPRPVLRTRWARAVDSQSPLPEYPRPQMVRRDWQSLNGLWDYAITAPDAGRPGAWAGRILVPFPIESQLSGVRRTVGPDGLLWYHRTFRAPPLPGGRRLLLHFGGVDWEARVWVNGHAVGAHRGGYDPFTLDVTDALVPAPDQDLVVAARDPTDSGPQPRGKQVQRPHGIWYTAVTGIWQTAWLEPVPSAYIAGLEITPDVDSGVVRVRATVVGTEPGARLRVDAFDAGRTIGSGGGAVDSVVVVPIPRARLWSPDDPYLYRLLVRLGEGDTVESYAGMRKIAVARDSDGVNRLFLNGRPLFEFGTLDQGWWPDGLYTAPTDQAARGDIATLRRLGFNLIRKHVKVEPERWYSWCDRLGMLVWQDMPSGSNDTPAGRAEFASELERMVDALRNHPSIVMWVPFNEGWGQHDTGRYVSWLKAHDPTRLVDDASGWTDRGVGDVMDVHAYPGPAAPPAESARAAVLGEFGGLGLPIPGHLWIERDSWGYRTFPTRDSLWAGYRALLAQLRYLVGDGLAAAVYTQTTDVETEVNGLMTYDRAVVKLPAAAAAANRRLYGKPPVTRTVVPDSRGDPQTWRYTFTTPDGAWTRPGFDDSGWMLGQGGFGKPETPGARVRTPWTSADIWLRRGFTLSPTSLVRPALRLHHDEDAEVYVNGVLVGTYPGYTTGYIVVPLDRRAAAALRVGPNTLAVHVHQTAGGQYIDAGVLEVIEP
jgi:hypothetical protein